MSSGRADDDLEVVHDLFETTFPSGPPQHGFVIAGGITIDRIVLLLTGPFPPANQRVSFVSEMIRNIVTSRVGPMEIQGNVPVHFFSTASVSDDTKWLTRFLNEHVCADASGARVFATLGPIDLRPPMGQILLCSMIGKSA